MEIRLEDFTQCCRCCLATVDAMQPIFGASLNDMLSKLMNFQITQNDGYPQQMCLQCVLKLSSSYNFYTMVLRSHNTLEEILKRAEKNGELFTSAANQEQKIEKVHTEIDKVEKTTSEKDYIQKKEPCNQNFNSRKRPAKRYTPVTPESENSEGPSDKEDDYQCSQCEHTSNDRHAFEVHLRTHLVGPKNTSTDLETCAQLCNVCGARFRWRTSLHKHLRRHRGGRHRCEVCPKAFVEASALNVHMRSHNIDQKPYECNTCGRSFTQQSSMKKHAQTHDARSQLKCSECHKSFLHKYSLRRHRDNAHSANECPLCGETFRGKKLFDAHMKLHKKEMDSPNTEMLTDNVMVTDTLNIQTVTVEFLCLICTQKFQSRESLEVHICASDNNR